MKKEIEPILRDIEAKLGWGVSESWRNEDFDSLQLLILQKTGISLSLSTLRRLWGRVSYGHFPSSTTLNCIARFAGFENWRDYLKKQKSNEAADFQIKERSGETAGRKSNFWFKISAAILVAIGVMSILTFRWSSKRLKTANYQLSSKRLTSVIPNSVVFTYDAGASPSDSIYIQQSWDKRKRRLVQKNDHTHTSIYYEPGFFKAKLLIDSQVVKEHSLIIPTDGWLGLIAQKTIPVYLEQTAFMHKNYINLASTAITKHNITLQPIPPIIKFYNVGNFKPTEVHNFSFNALVRNDLATGSAACQLTYIMLITDDIPIVIPLSVKGCTSELNLVSIDQTVSGKKTDLSGFGTDLEQWVNVVVKASMGKLHYFVNGQLAFESPLPKREVHIVGMAYIFQGTGAIKNILLEDPKGTVFKAF
jgi:hypothetical protein